MSTGDGVERVLQVGVGEAHDLSARTAVPARLRPGRGPWTDATAPPRISMRDPLLAQRGGRHLRQSASLQAASRRDPFLRHGLTAPGEPARAPSRGRPQSPPGPGATSAAVRASARAPSDQSGDAGRSAPTGADQLATSRSRAPTSAGCRAAARRRRRVSSGLGERGVELGGRLSGSGSSGSGIPPDSRGAGGCRCDVPSGPLSPNRRVTNPVRHVLRV
jgi:hypothetical protein